MSHKKVYIETMGCQMNVLDSELVVGLLRADGYRLTDDIGGADLVLLNTCSVREHAEDKVLSKLGALKKPKQDSSSMIIGVIGCMAERDPDFIINRMPHVDLICGPAELNKIPAMIDEVRRTKGRAVALTRSMSRKSTPLQRALEFDSVEALDRSRAMGIHHTTQPSPAQAYVRIQRGCDKFCTFCVVPFTRGPERSRPPQQIIEEARMLVDRGTVEITLLGQTVNSYVHLDHRRPVRLGELLERLNEINGLERIRFVTSYPGDFTDDILRSMRDLPKVCEYLHLPVQSGSDAVLERMHRRYTVREYLELVDRARAIVPELSLATDFIVGFSGETDRDFEQSLELVQKTGFKNIFVFKYSQRPGTAAAGRLPDDIPDDVKRSRNTQLLKAQERISLETNRTLIGRTVEVLVEGYSKRALKAQQAEQARGDECASEHSGQLVGRTRTDRIVVFSGGISLTGRLINVRIKAATALTLHGDVEQPAAAEPGMRLSLIPGRRVPLAAYPPVNAGRSAAADP